MFVSDRKVVSFIGNGLAGLSQRRRVWEFSGWTSFLCCVACHFPIVWSQHVLAIFTQLYHFADASSTDYDAISYFTTVYIERHVYCTQLVTRAMLAQMKTTTILRLKSVKPDGRVFCERKNMTAQNSPTLSTVVEAEK